MKRKTRRIVETAITATGIGAIFGSILFVPPADIQLHLLLTLLGVLLLEAGVWGLSKKILPSERRYLGLRDEGDRIIELIRELNSAAIDRDRGFASGQHFQETLGEIQVSFTRLAELASVDAHAGTVVASSTDMPDDQTNS